MADHQFGLNTGRFEQKQILEPIPGSASGCGALRVTQVEPAGLELARSGVRYALGQSAAVTGVAPVQAMPTAAAQWTFWNASTTDSLVFEMLGAYNNSGSASPGTTVVCCHFASPASNTTKAGLTVASAGNGTGTSAARVNSGVTITSPAAPAWFFVCRDDTAIVGALAFNNKINGRLIVPPLRGLGLCVIAPAAGVPLYVPVAQWTEIALDLE